jgi:hypothetical protein
MRNLLRKPLSWMVLAEFAVVAALVVLAWHLVTSGQVQPEQLLPNASPRADPGAAPGPLSVGPNAEQRTRVGPPPGLSTEASFWRVRLADLNRGQAEFEALEWRLVRSAMAAAQRYLESVVLPSVAQAERRHP